MAVPLSASGKHGRGKIGSGPTSIVLYSWTVDEKYDELDVTTAEDAGYEVTDVGVIGATVTIKGYYFASLSPIAVFTRNTVLTDLKLYIYNDGTDIGGYWGFPYSIATAVTVSSEVRGKVEFTATVRSRGPFTRPS